MENSTFNKKIVFLLISILILPFFTNAESILNNKTLQTTMVVSDNVVRDIDNDDMPSDEEMETRKAVVLADVGVYNISSTTEVEGKIITKFTIENNFSKAQGALQYAVQLKKHIDDNASGEVVDQFTNNDVVSLNSNQNINKVVEYTYPSDLNGMYDIWIVVYSETIGDLGFAKVKTIVLNGKGKKAFIQRETCFMTIDGVADKFSLTQGIDIDGQKEQLRLVCMVKGGDKEDIVVKFNTTKLNSYGDVVKTKKSSPVITLTEEEQEISVQLPLTVDTMPGAYDVTSIFYESKDEKNELGRVVAHYVIQGESAIIHDIQMDKNNYEKGAQISVDISLSGSADGYFSSRAVKEGSIVEQEGVLRLRIINQEGEQCIKDVEKEILFNTGLNIKEKTLIECINPDVSVIIMNKDGEILTEKHIIFDGKIEDNIYSNGEDLNVEGRSNNEGVLLLIGVGIGLIGSLLIVVIKYKKYRSKLIVTVIGFGSLMTYNTADAMLLQIKEFQHFNSCSNAEMATGNYCTRVHCYLKLDNGMCPTRGNAARATVSLDKAIYNEGENMMISTAGVAFYAKCNNPMRVNIDTIIRSENRIGGRYAYYGGWHNIAHHYGGAAEAKNQAYRWYAARNRDVTGMLNLTAPNTCGKYQLIFKIVLNHEGNITRYAKIPFSVKCPPPSCGNDNNKTFTNRPGSSLCMNTNVFQWIDSNANDGTWNWKCGNTASCSANRAFRCTGGYPRNVTVCNGSTTGLTTDAAWNKVDSCRGAGKCSYTASCTGGNPPYGAHWCTNSWKGLRTNTAWHRVHRCSGGKCEYIIPPPARCGSDNNKTFTNRPGPALCANTNDFEWLDMNAADGTWNWRCATDRTCSANKIVYSCGAGTNPPHNPPQGALWCTGSDKGLTADTDWAKVDTCTNTKKCEYIMPAECGTDHEASFDKTTDLTASPDTRCATNSIVKNFKTTLGLAGANGIAWTWDCERGLEKVSCEAYKNGGCNDAPTNAPYAKKEDACKVGSFNSVSLGNDPIKGPVLTWNCGTGKDKKSDGNPATSKYIGDFFSGSADKAPQVAFDNYTPTSGGDADCKCYPKYSYVCSYSDADCSNKCDGYALSVAVATKHDTECFTAEIKSISKTEFNLNKNSNQEECENKQIKCAACGANSAETGEGGIWHESH